MEILNLLLDTAQLEEQKAFYTKTLGFGIKSETATQFTIVAGTTHLTFKKTEWAVEPPYYHFAFNIPSNKIKEAHDWLQSRVELISHTVLVDDMPETRLIQEFEDWEAKAVFFYDPAGNIVEFIARQSSRPTTPPFGVDSVLCVSEIGIPTSNVVARAKELREKYDIFSFNKQENNANFWALGADHGLLLVVPNERAWFPTDKPARAFPLQMRFENRQNIVCELEVFGGDDVK